MLKEHFKLSSHPFHEVPPPECVLQDYRIKEGLKSLGMLMDTGNIALLIARTGVGKTTLITEFLKKFDTDISIKPIYLHLSTSGSQGLLRMIVHALGENPKVGKDRLFDQIFSQMQRSKFRLLLIIDEAHHLGTSALTDLRMLTSSLREFSEVGILLSGQPLLRDTLKSEALTDLRERISIRHEIPCLDEFETKKYIDSRLMGSGGDPDILHEDCKRFAYLHSSGVPRVINNICTNFMIQAVFAGQKKVDSDFFNKVKSKVII